MSTQLLKFSLFIKGSLIVVATLYFTLLWKLQNNLGDAETPRSIKVLLPKPLEMEMQYKKQTPPTNQARYARPSHKYHKDPWDRWEFEDTTLPMWMRNYFSWHKEERRSLTRNNWNMTRYIKLMCPAASRHCGGLADRIGPMPYLIRIAAQTRRLLLIDWEKPARLEQYLLPPQGGLDWRVPEWLSTSLEEDGKFATVHDKLLEATLNEKLTVAKVKFQSHDHGAAYYNENCEPGEPEFQTVYREMFRVIFTPAPRVAAKINAFWSHNKLTPGVYSSAHLRALYAVSTRPSTWVRGWARNAVDCLALYTDRVFFASDSDVATREAVAYGNEMGITVLSTSEHDKPALHIDKTPNWQKIPPSDFDPTFVDLFVLGSSRCVGTSMGNFGRLASWMSSNVSCAFTHHAATGKISCSSPNIDRRQINSKGTELLSPMQGNDLVSEDRDSLQDEELYPFPGHSSSKQRSDLWNDSSRLPDWMKDYFRWHHDVRKSLSPENWKNYKYLVMVCLHATQKCGGTSDRLQSVPFAVRLAAETNRLLLITWDHPAALEEFLLPPQGGLDWRVPPWLKPNIIDPGSSSVRKTSLRAKDNRTITTAKLQAHDHGSHYYINSTGQDAVSYRQVYHEVWSALFTPVKEIAKLIEDELELMGLVPGLFSFAHLRANYGIEEKGRDPVLVRNWTRNSVNCLSELGTSGPVFFASDNQYAKEVAVEYAKEKGVRIETRKDEMPPLHLDLATNWKTPSDFYDVFVDLYLMSMGRCMTYNMGGYGKWAHLISGRDMSCSVRHWTKGVNKRTAKKDGCTWSGIKDSHSQSGFERPLFLPPMD